MKHLLSILFLSTFFISTAQNKNLNDYKYIVVKNKYDFQDKANEYRLNELIVYEFEQRNFKAFRDSGILPADFNRSTCNALKVNIEKSGLLSVRLVISLINCDGVTVFETKKGIGRTKSYDKAYFEAVRDAMKSFDNVNYKYLPKESANEITAIDNQNKVAAPAMAYQPPAISSQITAVKKDYATKDNSYYLIATANDYHVFKDDAIIGTLKRSKGGCFLATTTQFIGIGFYFENGIGIEYDKNGRNQLIKFEKVN
jgi:hypothetical protein